MSGTCSNEKTLLEDVKFCQGKKSLPGTKKRVYLADIRDILKFPKLADRSAEGAKLSNIPTYPASIASGNSTVANNFEMAQGKFFAQVDIINNNGKLVCEPQGTFGSKTFKNTYTGNAPGTEEDITGLIAELLNAEVVAVVPTRSGKFRVVGSEEFPAEVNPSQDTGQAATDTNQTVLEIVADDEMPAPFFYGKLPVSGGELDCTTGEVTVTPGE
jgi:hypothetical protein